MRKESAGSAVQNCGQLEFEQFKREYEAFFRCGGYRLMRLLVIKAGCSPDEQREGLDVAGLMRLRCSEMTPQEYREWITGRELDKIMEIYVFDTVLRERMRSLPRNWGQILDMHFGRGIRTRSSGAGIRKRTVENALAGLCAAIEDDVIRSDPDLYDFALEGLPVVRRIMSYIESADGVGCQEDKALILQAVESMKLFRKGRQGILYDEALEELYENTCTYPHNKADTSGTDAASDCMVIRQETRESQQLSGLERKLQEGSSSVLLDRMYEIYSIMAAIKEYLPDKYERMMSFHWTRSEEKLTELFREAAAMIAAAEENRIC